LVAKFLKGPDAAREHSLLRIKLSKKGKKVDKKVWEGAKGLEWELPSPPEFHSWPEPPKIK